MKHVLSRAAFGAALLCLSPAALLAAQNDHQPAAGMDMSKPMAMPVGNSKAMAMPGAQMGYAAHGEVVAVDVAGGKVKLKHSAVPGLGWPAMTMFFAVADKAQLAALKVGDRVDFKFNKPNGGPPPITQIKLAK